MGEFVIKLTATWKENVNYGSNYWKYEEVTHKDCFMQRVGKMLIIHYEEDNQLKTVKKRASSVKFNSSYQYVSKTQFYKALNDIKAKLKQKFAIVNKYAAGIKVNTKSPNLGIAKIIEHNIDKSIIVKLMDKSGRYTKKSLIVCYPYKLALELLTPIN